MQAAYTSAVMLSPQRIPGKAASLLLAVLLPTVGGRAVRQEPDALARDLARGFLEIADPRFGLGADTLPAGSGLRLRDLAYALARSPAVFRLLVPAELGEGLPPDTVAARRRTEAVWERLVAAGAPAARLIPWQNPGFQVPGRPVPRRGEARITLIRAR